MNIKILSLGTALGLGLSGLTAPRPAEACGGFFCNQTPVIQTGEQIIFTVDTAAEVTEAIINISYQGPAAEFAWLLPLVVEPTNVDVGPSQAFVVSDQLTRPTFQITRFETRGICGPNEVLLAGAAEDASAGGAPAPTRGAGGVEVLRQEAVGPYDTVVLRGTDPQAVRTWLVDNEYLVTDEMMEAVVPYVAKGDVLLALKLQKDNDSGDIQPIWLTLPQAEACIPLRLTAIAAQADMDVTAIVLSNDGRAIPDNYFHITPNLLKVDWMTGGSNYRQIIGDAADEAGGNAFTTEYAGPASIFEQQIWAPGRYDVARLRSHTDLGDFLLELQNQGLRSRSELRGIITRHFPRVGECPQCSPFEFRGTQIDPGPVVDEIEERILEPERRVQQLLDGYEYATRLYTLISPEEMTIDPLFSFDASLPNISNRHEATMIQYCGVGGTPGSAGVEIVLEDGSVISFDASSGRDRSLLDSMPAAARIEQLKERTLIADNGGRIREIIDEHNDRVGLGGCSGCASADGAATGGAASLMVLGLLGAALAARRRR